MLQKIYYSNKNCTSYELSMKEYWKKNTYSALHKYWNSKDKIALLAVESRHLPIWLKDEYETKLQHVTFYY